MEKQPRKKLGRVKCLGCREPVFLFATATRKYTYTCQNCDSSGYAEPDGDQHRRWTDELGAVPAADPAPAEPKREPAPAPVPPKAKPRGVFDLSQLGVKS